ncbi:M20 aminoacylase family protein [Aureimonas glaciei]|jgi:hippurate hydrolase|uniref:Amidohydrolase n=1 Tax=Aureimonas glaciei TaxID=1776957 RepID=A0A917DBH9_9HYPH|nr:M20 aminoacylase family protein [Aureimonas glaciei]GGD23470.1 amidohydrolase [Aureimonas glaciei]
MPIVNRFADFHDDITAWRRDIHAHPETQYDVHRTAGVVADKLREFGVDEIVTGVGRTGVVGIIKGRDTGSGRVVGLRADMDALPITETTGLAHASTIAGKMHACGHDGHTAMLLGAARYLCETRNFDGAVALIFQPAEEGGAGGKAMVDDGMMDRFGIQEVYGLHNQPGMALGTFAIRPGPMMAAADEFSIAIEGYGGHAARPHRTIDATLVAAQITVMLQTVVARNVDPIESAVLSVTQIHAGDAFNVIPQTALLTGTVRTLKEEIRDLMERRVTEVVDLTARALGATAVLDYQRNYPVVVNHASNTAFAASVAEEIAGKGRVVLDTPPVMGGEDFAFMLNARPGAFIFAGNGDTAPVHHPQYDFNDALTPFGCSYWARLVETAMPLRG